MSKRAILYARVSSDDTGKDGRNLKSQLDMCREYAQAHGYTIIAELHEDDRGASGASFELPQLSAILDMAERKEFDVLVVRELDRLSRNLAKQLIVEESLRRAGVSIEYVLGEYPDSPEGNLNKHIRATIAEFEREKIRERNVRGKRNVVKGGRIMLNGARPPYGYAVSEDKHALVICESEARIIRLVFDWYTVGDENGERLSARQIAARLSEMKAPTWGDLRGLNVNKIRGYGVWSSEVIFNILRNETYAGRWHYGKLQAKTEWLAVSVPAIITSEQFKAAADLRQAKKSTSKHNVIHEYLMRSRLTCECGYGVFCFARQHDNDDGFYLYYRCLTATGDVAGGYCGARNFRADHVDALLWGWLREYFQDPADLRNKLETYKTEHDKMNAPALALLRVNESLIFDNQAQLDRLVDLYLSGTFDKTMLVDRKARLQETIAKLEGERGELQKRIAHAPSDDEIEDVITFAYDLAAGIAQADKSFDKRRRIIEVLDVRAILATEDGEKVCHASFILSGDARKRLALPKRGKVLSVVGTNTTAGWRNTQNSPIVITGRLVLPGKSKTSVDIGALFSKVGVAQLVE